MIFNRYKAEFFDDHILVSNFWCGYYFKTFDDNGVKYIYDEDKYLFCSSDMDEISSKLISYVRCGDVRKKR